MRSDDGVALRVVLANTADRASREVVQVYWRPEGSAPVRLVGYAVADEVVPGEERSVTSRVIRARSGSGTKQPRIGSPRPAAPFSSPVGLGDIRLEIPRP